MLPKMAGKAHCWAFALQVPSSLVACRRKFRKSSSSFTCGTAQQSHLRTVDDHIGDVERLGENEWHQLDADSDRFGGEKWRSAEFWIVRNGKVISAERTTQN